MRGLSEKFPKSQAFVLLRYTLIIAIAYLLLAEHGFSDPPTVLVLLVVVALASNVAMGRLPARITDTTTFNAGIILGDTLWITAALLYSGRFRHDFFYVYFFVLLLAAIGENLFLIALGAIVACSAYFYVLSHTTTPLSLWSSSTLIRIPFLFAAAAFYGYLVDRVRREQQRALAQADTVARLEHEICERKRAEQGLQEAKDYAENLIDSSLDMIISADADRNIVEFNRAAEHAFGYSKEGVVGKPVNFLYANPSEGAQIYESLMQHGRFSGEIWNKRKNGEMFCSYLSVSVIHDLNGAVVGTIGTSRDITEQKRAEKAIRETKAFYERIVGEAGDAIVVIDREGTILTWNTGAERMFGWTAREALGQSYLALQGTEVTEDIAETMRPTFAGEGFSNLERRRRRKDGTWVDVLLTLSPVRDTEGKIIAAQGIIKDITERRQTEQALRESEERYRTLFENAPIGLGVADAEGNLVAFNDAMLEPGGYTYEDIATIANVAHLYHDPNERKEVLAIARRQGFLRQHEVRFRRKDGTSYDALLSLTPVTLEGRTGWQAMVQDVTERKRATEALRAQAHELAMKTERLEALATLSRTVTATLDPPQVLDFVAKATVRLLNVNLSRLWLWDEGAGVLCLAASDGDPDLVAYPRQAMHVGEGIMGRTFERQETLATETAATDPHFLHRDWAEEKGIQAHAAVPLVVDNRAVGVLTAARRAPEPFREEELILLRSFASHTTIALENARHLHETESRARRLRTLTDITRLMTASLNHQEVANSIVKAAAELLGADLAALWVEDETAQALHLAASCGGEDLAAMPLLRVGKGEGVIGAIWETGEPTFVPDLREEPRQLNTPLLERSGLCSFAGLPLRIGDRLIGVLSLLTRKNRNLTPEERELIALFADQAAISLDKARLYREIGEQKRHLEETIAELKRAEEELKTTQLQLIQSAKFESVGQLAAGVAHEVKNPLAIILQGLAYLSRDELAPGDDTVTLVLNKMHDAVRRADLVIRGLLDFSTPPTADVMSGSLNIVLEHSLSLVHHEFVRTRVTVVKKLGKDLPPLKLDRNKIEQVLVNLFMNAIQAMPEGGTLTVNTRMSRPTSLGPHRGRQKTDPVRIDESLVVVEIEDTGTGIPEDKLDRVFDPFFTTKPVGQGTGLGLSVTRKIIELHRGTIDLRNRDEGGVRVTITFKTEGDDGDAVKLQSQQL